MENKTLLCKNCRNIFDLPADEIKSQNPIIRCPKCGDIDIKAAPCWAPLNSGSNIFDEAGWEYECQQCRKGFVFPVPKSPKEEKERKCPFCGSGHIHLLTDLGAQPLYCG
jgi:DNA-directed RNA polymerase subunit RPC12/RpoP